MGSSGDYQTINTTDGLEACYYANSSGTIRIWRNHDQFNFPSYAPLFLIQLAYVLFINHLLVAILKPLRQPPIVGQILAGVLLGQRSIFFQQEMFPYKSVMLLETYAYIALLFYLFLIGLDMDINLISATGMTNKVVSIALAGTLVPMAVGLGAFFLVIGESQEFITQGGYMFCAVALTATNFQELTQILTDLRILHLDIGRIALSSALLSDLFTWMLLLACILVSNPSQYYEVLSTVGFILICVVVVRPALSWVFCSAIRGDNNLSDTHISFVLAGVLLCGFITDGCGAHSAIGAFTLGVIMPKKQPITNTFKDKLDDFLVSSGLPGFFLLTGFRSNLVVFSSHKPWMFVLVVLFGFGMSKILITFLVSLLHKIPPKEGLALGLLMNTKGLLALIVLNTACNRKDLVDEAFPPTIFALFVMTCVIEPILAATYKATKQFVNYKCRTIQRTKEKAEFRIMACIHSTRNIAGMINLLQVSNATNQSAIRVFAVHLVEHLGHSTAMLLMNDGSNSTGFNDSCPMQATEAEQFKKAFENYEKTSNNAVNVHTLTSVSPHESMHEDICCLAEDKRVAFIIIPYIRPLTTNDKIRNANTNRTVNLNLLQNTPCSVCIFVDRGLGSDEDKESQLKDHHGIQHLLMLFLGGPDDREALAYAWRMAAHPNVKLTVVRFLPGKDPRTVLHQKHNSEVARCTEKQADDEDIYEFKFKTMNDESISYIENVVNNGEEIVAAIKDLSDNCDLYIIGRREGAESRLTYDLSLDNSTNFPELGVIGSVLAMSNFSSHASVLVIQQYISRKTANKSESRKHDRMSIDHYCETIASQIIDDDYDDDEEDDN